MCNLFSFVPVYDFSHSAKYFDLLTVKNFTAISHGMTERFHDIFFNFIRIISHKKFIKILI